MLQTITVCLLLGNATLFAQTPNIIRNGDFAAGLDGWTYLQDGAVVPPVGCLVANNEMALIEQSNGSIEHGIRQTVSMQANLEYTLSFDLGSSASSTGFAVTFSGWGRNNQITATSVMQHFRYSLSFAQAKCGPLVFTFPADRRVRIDNLTLTVAPVANDCMGHCDGLFAGSDTTVDVGTTVALRMQGYDYSGEPGTVTWRKIGGPAVTLINADTDHPTFTPLDIGTYTFQLTYGGMADTVKVSAHLPDIISLPGVLQAEYYKAGGEGVGYHDLTIGNAGAKFRTDKVDIGVSGDVGGGYTIGWTAAGEWLVYDVNLTQTIHYTISARMASAVAGLKICKLSVDDTAVATFNLTDASGRQSWKTVSIGNVWLTAGRHSVKIAMTTGNCNVNYLSFVPGANYAPVANGGYDKTITANTILALDGSASVDSDNYPRALNYTWSQVSGPTGAVVTGINTARPTFTSPNNGSYVLQLQVSDGAQTSVDKLVLCVYGGINYELSPQPNLRRTALITQRIFRNRWCIRSAIPMVFSTRHIL
jgi:hypothetical protein